MTKYEKNLSILIVLDEGSKEVRKGNISAKYSGTGGKLF